MIRRSFFVLLLLSGVAMLSGCAFGVAQYGPGGSLPGLYSDAMVFPAENSTQTVYQLTTDDFEIRGTVEAEGESTTILGLVSRGDNGYRSLLKQAREQGCDDVINIRSDVEVTNIFCIYVKVRTMLTGTGIKWK